MGANLAIKDIEFNGATLRAAQDELGKIWVGVRWICEGLGFNEGKVKTERKKIQEDLVLSQGKKFLPLGNDNANSDVLCLDLDYIPLWLAKISITPTMQRENPELVQRLITYQIKAKDVLAAAFLKKKPEAIPALTPSYPEAIHIDLPNIPDYTEKFEILNSKIDKLNMDLGKAFSLLLQNKNDVIVEDNTSLIKTNKIEVEEERKIREWKKEVNSLIDKLMLSGKFVNRNAAFKMIYDYINKTYGICLEQCKREYREKYNIGKPLLLDVIYDDEQLRSIFTASLLNKVEEMKALCLDPTDKIIKPLAEALGDSSNCFMITYRKVYIKMKHIDPNINWKNLENRYMQKYGKSQKGKVSKRMIINKSDKLLEKFKRAVDVMIVEMR